MAKIVPSPEKVITSVSYNRSGKIILSYLGKDNTAYNALLLKLLKTDNEEKRPPLAPKPTFFPSRERTSSLFCSCLTSAYSLDLFSRSPKITKLLVENRLFSRIKMQKRMPFITDWTRRSI